MILFDGFYFCLFFAVVDKLAMYNKTRNRGLAFVTMGSPEEALAALNNLESSVSILGSVIFCECLYCCKLSFMLGFVHEKDY